MITPDEALHACHAAGRAGTFSIAEEAHARARAIGQSPADLRHALTCATGCAYDDWRWRVVGPSIDGTECEMFVVIDNGSLSLV